MPPLQDALRDRIQEAVELVRAGELVRSAGGAGSVAWRELHPGRLALLYEVAFLRMFVEWEIFLEATFYRYMCGYVSSFGQAAMASGTFYRSLASAESAVLSGRPFVLWHDPVRSAVRARSYMTGCRHELVFTSNSARLLDFAAVRHRIAHGQSDAKRKFDLATMSLVGRRYRGSRPGKFLRDWDGTVVPPVRWLESIGNELTALSTQII